MHCTDGTVGLAVCSHLSLLVSIQMMHTDCTVPYGEVDGLSALLGYQTANAAGCKVTACEPTMRCF